MKVAFFDYWTRGLGNFLPLAEPLVQRGHEVLLLHIGSFREPQPKEERLHDLLVRDISFYNTKMIYNMLERERPDVVISLNTTYILDRAMVLAARELGIKTVFLMHGNKSWQEQTGERVEIARKSFNSIARKLSRAGKYARDVMPNYLHSGFKSGEPGRWWRPWNVILRYFRDPGYCFYFPPHPEELTHDKCLVYANSDVEYYRKVGYAPESIVVTGNPKLDRLQARLANQDFPIVRIPEDLRALVEGGEKYAVLIEDSFPESGMGWSDQDRNEYLDTVARALAKENIRLVVKVHPSSRAEAVRPEDQSIFKYTSASLDDLLYHSEFCVTHFSTAVNQAVLLGKTILQPRWGKSRMIMDYYIKRGVSLPWSDPADLPARPKRLADLENYKRESITVMDASATENVLREIVTWPQGASPHVGGLVDSKRERGPQTPLSR